MEGEVLSEKHGENCIDQAAEVALMTIQDDKQSDQPGCNDRAGHKTRIVTVLRDKLLLVLTLVGVIAGFGLGFALRSVSMTDSAYMWLGLPGDVFMRAIYCTILPLIVSSVITATASTESRSNGRVYTVTAIYIAFINTIGIVVGVAVYYIVSPARFVSINADDGSRASRDMTRLETEDIIADLIRNFVPNNLVLACTEKVQTEYVEERYSDLMNVTNVKFLRKVGSASGTNILGLIVVSALIGLASRKIQRSNETFIEFFRITADIIITIMNWVVWLTPIGVLSLIALPVAKIKNLDQSVKSCGMFMLTVIVQNALLFIVIMPGFYFVCRRKNPITYLYSVLPAAMASVAAPSSLLAIPELVKATEVQHRINSDISRFAISFGVALCRVGSAAFIIASVLFLQHLEHVEVGTVRVIYAMVLTFIASLAIPSVPSGSIVCILIILSSLNFTTQNIGILMAMDWLLDRARTISNVNAILLGTVVVQRFDKQLH